ncbi:alkaline phosphatase family protein, partial [Paramuribaculum intestinale]
MRKKKRTDIQHKILCAVLLTLVTASAGAQTAPKRPQMVVGIMVEGLSQDYLDLLHNHFTDGGFKRLMRDGATLSNVDYGPGVDAAAATAIIYTGAAPSVNGIPAEYVYDRERRRSRSILLDTAKIGNFTNETYSPAAILVSTLGDEVRLDAAGTGWVYSVAPDPAQAIIMTGHAGNSGFWIN